MRWNGDNSIYLLSTNDRVECKPVPVEITYGLERLCMFVQGKNNVFDLDWNNDGVKYKEVFFQAEKEFSAYNFEFANTDTLLKVLKIPKMSVNPCSKKNFHYQLMINV